jgi:2-polyprenyl-3-methyl-5-hydroxy-6-metoxy-1,4-benzoquinol methylase
MSVVQSVGNPALGAAMAPCPVCGDASQPYCDRSSFDHTWHMRRCTTCGHGFILNRPSPDLLQSIYSRDVESHHHQWRAQELTAGSHEARPDCRKLIGRMLSLTSERGESLDVGSGDGAFSYHLAKHGFKPTLIDLDPRAADAARLVKGSTFELCTFEDFTDRRRDGLPSQKFSAIVMSQVLEHALDPLNWLKRSAEVLSSDGVLVVAVPNFAGVYRMLGRRDPFIAPPIHLNYFTPTSMRKALEKAGLRAVRVASFSHVTLAPRPGAAGLLRKAVQSTWNGASRVMDGTTRGIILHAYAKRADAA